MLQSPRKRKRMEDTFSLKSSQYFDIIPEDEISDVSKKKSDDVSNGKLADGWRRKTHTCKICFSKLNGTKLSNLGNHLRSLHPEIYDEICGQKETIAVKRLKLLQHMVEIV